MARPTPLPSAVVVVLVVTSAVTFHFSSVFRPCIGYGIKPTRTALPIDTRRMLGLSLPMSAAMTEKNKKTKERETTPEMRVTRPISTVSSGRFVARYGGTYLLVRGGGGSDSDTKDREGGKDDDENDDDENDDDENDENEWESEAATETDDGGSNDEDGVDDDDDDDDDDAATGTSVDAIVPEVVDGPWANAAASASRIMPPLDGSSSSSSSSSSPEMEQQGRSYFLCAVLWSALALDVVLNKSKRAAIFAGTIFASQSPTLTSTFSLNGNHDARGAYVWTSNLVSPTASLATGFALAAAIAYLLSESFLQRGEEERRNCEEMKDGEKEGGGGVGVAVGGDETQQGRTRGRGDGGSGMFVARTRRRLALGLATFGAINLGAHCTPREFLGMSAAAINGHNALIAINGWLKDSRSSSSSSSSSPSRVKLAIADVVDCARIILGGKKDEGGNNTKHEPRVATGRYDNLYAAACLLSIWSFLIRSMAVIRALAFARQTNGPTQPMLDKMVSPFASLARFTMAATLGVTLKDALDSGNKANPFVVKLSGVVSVCSLAVSIPMLLTDKGMRRLTSDAGKLFLLSLVTGWNCLDGFYASKRR